MEMNGKCWHVSNYLNINNDLSYPWAWIEGKRLVHKRTLIPAWIDGDEWLVHIIGGNDEWWVHIIRRYCGREYIPRGYCHDSSWYCHEVSWRVSPLANSSSKRVKSWQRWSAENVCCSFFFLRSEFSTKKWWVWTSHWYPSKLTYFSRYFE